MRTLDEFLADDDFRAWAKKQFVENECGTDEYRESQPEKGLMFIAEFFGALRNANHTEKQGLLNRTFDEADTALEAHVLGLVQKWITVVHNGFETHDNDTYGWWVYAGAEELVPILDLYFEYAWANRYHPYYADGQGLLDYCQSDYDYYLEEKERGE